MRDLFGQKKTGVFSKTLRQVWNGACDFTEEKAGPSEVPS